MQINLCFSNDVVAEVAPIAEVLKMVGQYRGRGKLSNAPNFPGTKLRGEAAGQDLGARSHHAGVCVGEAGAPRVGGDAAIDSNL